MLIGVPKEIKTDEYRVGLTPESVLTLVNGGHQVMVLADAGLGIGKDCMQIFAEPCRTHAFGI